MARLCGSGVRIRPHISWPMSAARSGCLHRRQSAAAIGGRPDATAHK